jgi:hypothetical protein
MSKRERRLRVRFGEHDVRITTHAIARFRQRVLGIPTRQKDVTPLIEEQVIRLAAPMVPNTTPVIRLRHYDSRIYLAFDRCVFVMTSDGVIVTVLLRREGDGQFADSIKEVRREKRNSPLIKDSARSRFRRKERMRHSREPRQQNPIPRRYDHEDND